MVVELGAKSRLLEKNDREDKKTLTDETRCPPEASSYMKRLFLFGRAGDVARGVGRKL
jgi:hypothetical protein